MVAILASKGLKIAHCSANNAFVSLAAVKQAVLVAPFPQQIGSAYTTFGSQDAGCLTCCMTGCPSTRSLTGPARVVQDSERKAKREPKETPEELQECEMVFAAF